MAANAYKVMRMKQIPLNMNSEGAAPPTPEKKPVVGWCAIGFGVLGVFGPGLVFSPIAMICSIIALFVGQALWGILGLLLAVLGLVTSVQFWLVVGMGWILTSTDWAWLKAIMEMLKFGGGGTDI